MYERYTKFEKVFATIVCLIFIACFAGGYFSHLHAYLNRDRYLTLENHEEYLTVDWTAYIGYSAVLTAKAHITNLNVAVVFHYEKVMFGGTTSETFHFTAASIDKGEKITLPAETNMQEYWHLTDWEVSSASGDLD